MGAWSPDLELQLAEACLKRAPLHGRRAARDYVRRLRAEIELKELAETADTEAAARPGFRRDLEG